MQKGDSLLIYTDGIVDTVGVESMYGAVAFEERV